jgi:hypothetical protein
MKQHFNILCIFFILLIILYLLYIKIYDWSNSIYVLSNIDNRYYRVKKGPNQQESADTLAHININNLKLIDYLYNIRLNNKYEKEIFFLKERYKPDKLIENIYTNKEDTTYTINKGEQIVFCIKTRDENKKLYDINLLMYVSIHELAHLGTEHLDNSHGPDFVNFFTFLLTEAIKIGVYNYEDYKESPKEYCGMKEPINTTIVKN